MASSQTNKWQNFKISISVYLIYALMWLIFLTCKKSYRDNGVKVPQNGCVVVFWHGRLAFMSYAYKKWWQPTKKLAKVIISDHKDGELITRVMKLFNIGAIRGSSSKGGAKALIGALRDIKSGTDVIVTPDGPRGPRHSVADGAVIIAQKTNSEIYVLNYEASSFWEFKSWDKMILPKPFCKINFSLSRPFDVNALSIEAAKERIQNELWTASQKDGGKSVQSHKHDFIQNLKIWWAKNESKNPQISNELREILEKESK
ncbi:lysophospholipid acyltransferase family protein [Campylobacter curvus]|uniref:lysophospholipid acyltransferase family protein n=1 Tax=Campylobacter curvus TaxID=200 RepID=UPI00146FE6AE|nr:lysophospholipid acyltransferase family protein [Campylobacter curvus]